MKTNNLIFCKRKRALIFSNLFAMFFLLSNSLSALENHQVDQAAKAEPITVFALGQAVKGRVQRGLTHSLTQAFIVEASSSRVNLSCAVTNMLLSGENKEKYSVLNNSLKPDSFHGCLFEVPAALSTIGASTKKTANFEQGGDTQTYSSDYVTFQSSDGKRFKEDVFVTVYWQSTGDMQLSGQYEGKIQLRASTPDVLSPPK